MLTARKTRIAPQAWMRALVWAVSIGLLIRFYLLVNKTAVNILFWDQWDLYTPFFQDLPLWRVFFWQHGPPRLGIGFVLEKVFLDLTRWNMRQEAIALLGLIFIAMLIALYLRKLAFAGGLGLSDVLIPILFLTPSQYEALIVTPIPSHGIFPLLLIMAYCVAWVQKRPSVRYPAIALLNVLLVFTGFGIFAAAIGLVLLALEVYHAVQQRDRAKVSYSSSAFVLSALALASFFLGYRFDAAEGCASHPERNLFLYVWYGMLMFGKFVGFSGHSPLPSVVGGALFGALLVIIGLHFKNVLKGSSSGDVRSQIIIVLIGYSLLFSLSTAVGRLCLGIASAQSPRYMTHLIPGLLGICFHVFADETKRKATIAALAMLCFLGLNGSFQRSVVREMEWISNSKRAWKHCYLRHESVDLCNELTGFKIYPDPATTRLQEKLLYLKENRLNLYATWN